MLNLKELNIQYITDESGERHSVIISLQDFEALLEDLADLAMIAERGNEPVVTHENLVAKLTHDLLYPVNPVNPVYS